MKSWGYGINSYRNTVAVFLREGPWWAFFLEWFADHSCGLIPRWHIPVLKNKRVTVEGEDYMFGEYYGTLGDLYHLVVCQRVFAFADSKITTKAIPMEWDRCKALSYDRDQEYWDEEERSGEEMRKADTEQG